MERKGNYGKKNIKRKGNYGKETMERNKGKKWKLQKNIWIENFNWRQSSEEKHN